MFWKTIQTAGFFVCTISIAASLIGFGPAGIAGGSLAAFCQSVIGNVQAGSWFANLTSYGMQNYFVNGIYGGGAFAAIGTIFKRKEEPPKTISSRVSSFFNKESKQKELPKPSRLWIYAIAGAVLLFVVEFNSVFVGGALLGALLTKLAN